MFNNIIVLGSINANKDDRFMPKEELQTFQILFNENSLSIGFFKQFTDVGISSLDFFNEEIMYFATPEEVFELDIKSKNLQKCNIDCNLKDIHEMKIIENKLWISNTGHNQAISYDLITNKTETFDLINLINKKTTTDTFHCNQVFRGYDNDLYVLVHHLKGKQLIHRIASKLIKKHGDGGVINITNEKFYNLSLNAPHSVRKLNDEYWVCDSKNNRLCVYDSSWNFITYIDHTGWGRGAFFNGKDLFYVGVFSASRKRYKDTLKNILIITVLI